METNDHATDAREGEDQVRRPQHYMGGTEAIDVIEAVVAGLPAVAAYQLGNVIKYAVRAGRKGDAATDLAKANNYAHRLVTGAWRREAEGGDAR